MSTTALAITVVSALTCPTVYDDGCAGSNHNAAYATTLQALALSGQSFMTRPPWMVAGIDYPVGHDKTLALKDPATVSIPGCTWYPTGVSGRTSGPTLWCANTNNLNLSGLELASTGGHPCTGLFIHSSVTGTVTIANNHYKWDMSCVMGAVSGYEGPYSLSVMDDTFDMTDSSPSGSLYAISGVGPTSGGTITIEYNAFLNSQCRWTNLIDEGATPGDVVAKYNAFVGMGYSCGDPSIHLEVVQIGAASWSTPQTMQNFVHDFNLVSMAGGWHGGLAGMISPFLAVSGGVDTVVNTDISNNTIIGNTQAIGNNSGSQAIMLQHNKMTNVTIAGNYVGMTGLSIFAYCVSAPDGQAGQVTPFGSAPFVSGNIQLETGQDLPSTMSYQVNGCLAYP
jgi:hypothetical protein